MHKAFVALALMLASIATLAHSQTAPQPSAPPQQELAPTPKLNLTLEQGHTIKEFIKDMKADFDLGQGAGGRRSGAARHQPAAAAERSRPEGPANQGAQVFPDRA